jgi:hypothetical protein
VIRPKKIRIMTGVIMMPRANDQPGVRNFADNWLFLASCGPL